MGASDSSRGPGFQAKGEESLGYTAESAAIAWQRQTLRREWTGQEAERVTANCERWGCQRLVGRLPASRMG